MSQFLNVFVCLRPWALDKACIIDRLAPACQCDIVISY